MERENGSCSQLRPSIFFRVQSLKCVITRGCRRGVSPCQRAGLRLCCCLCQSVQAQPEPGFGLLLLLLLSSWLFLAEMGLELWGWFVTWCGQSLAGSRCWVCGETSGSLPCPFPVGSFFPPSLPVCSAQVKAKHSFEQQGDHGGRASPGYPSAVSATSQGFLLWGGDSSPGGTVSLWSPLAQLLWAAGFGTDSSGCPWASRHFMSQKSITFLPPSSWECPPMARLVFDGWPGWGGVRAACVAVIDVSQESIINQELWGWL